MKLEKYFLLFDIVLQTILVAIITWSLVLHTSKINVLDLVLVFFFWFYQVFISGLGNYYTRSYLSIDIKPHRQVHLKANFILFLLFIVMIFTKQILSLLLAVFIGLGMISFSVYYFIISVKDYQH